MGKNNEKERIRIVYEKDVKSLGRVNTKTLKEGARYEVR